MVWRRVMFGMVLALSGTGVVRGDGGVVRCSERVGGYQVTVFTSPTPLRAGAVDVSVFVQDAGTLRPTPDTLVTLHVFPGGQPEDQVLHPATHEAATNKLLHAAHFELPAAGWWHIDVAIEGPLGPAATGLDLEAFPPLPRQADQWLWIALPLLPIALYIFHYLATRRSVPFS